MKIKIMHIFAVFLVASLFVVAGCGTKTDGTGTTGGETTAGNQASTSGQGASTDTAVAGAPDTGSIETLNEDLNAEDLDSIAVTVDENTFT